MLNNLNTIIRELFNKVITKVQQDPRVIGAWHFGSVMRGTSDEHSDVDPVFLITPEGFEGFNQDIEKIFSTVADKIILIWPETYNNEFFQNHCVLLEKQRSLFQFDCFTMKQGWHNEWFCQIHLQGVKEEHIIFDKQDAVKEILPLEFPNQTYPTTTDIKHIIINYLFHVYMCVKSALRRDIFKLLNLQNTLFHTHKELLYSDVTKKLPWGGWYHQIHHCLSLEHQNILKQYFTSADLPSIYRSILKGLEYFSQQARELCLKFDHEYPEKIHDTIVTYFLGHWPKDEK